MPLLALLNAFALWRAAMREGRDGAPFLLALTFFELGLAGLVFAYLAAPCTAGDDDLGRGLAAVVARLRAGRTDRPAAGDPGLHLLVVFVFLGKVTADAGYH